MRALSGPPSRRRDEPREKGGAGGGTLWPPGARPGVPGDAPLRGPAPPPSPGRTLLSGVRGVPTTRNAQNRPLRAGPGWEPSAREIFVSPWVRGRGSGSQLVWAPGAQPWGGGGNPQPNRIRPLPHQELLASGTLWPPPHAHPRQDIVSSSKPLWDTPRDTKTHWLVARHPHSQTRSHCIPDAHSHTIGAHTHSIPGTHTFVATYSFLRGDSTGAHTQTQPALDTHSHSTDSVQAHRLPRQAHTAA